ncbi:hypothetical protein HK101_010026 [Irineochytrium annulatum]|nr:hypothetical protein HK101_010026 [Irineochytrium annulatum]
MTLQLIHRLRGSRREKQKAARPGSEHVVFVAALVCASKGPAGGDHTFTNKTWSDLTGVPLPLINSAERELLCAVGHDVWIRDTAHKRWMDVTVAAMEDYRNAIQAATAARRIFFTAGGVGEGRDWAEVVRRDAGDAKRSEWTPPSPVEDEPVGAKRRDPTRREEHVRREALKRGAGGKSAARHRPYAPGPPSRVEGRRNVASGMTRSQEGVM